MPKDSYLKSIYAYPEQFNQAWEETHDIDFPVEYSEDITDLVIAGMGGSSFGGRVLQAAFSPEKLLVPFTLVDGYDLPAFADEQTLVVVTSYSGNTEEALHVIKEARSRGCKIIIFTTGGKLAEIAKSKDIPAYIFSPDFNYSGAPRTSLGYIIGGTLGILSNLGLIEFSSTEAKKVYRYASSFIDMIKDEDRMAVQISKKILGRIPVFVSAEHLRAGAHIWRNFLNETAKYIGFTYEIPEMNHHFLDGLSHPRDLRDNYLFIFLNSHLYNDRNQKRIAISREVVKKYGILDVSITLSARNALSEIFELVIIGSLVSFNLARVNSENPTSNEMVDYLKEKLS